MTEPRKVQIVRPHQKIDEYIYRRNTNVPENTYEQILLDQKDYETVGWKRVNAIQALPLKENWPITIGNGLATFSSGILGGMITRRMARNLSLHVTLSTLPTSGACFLVVTMSHLSAYYYFVLRQMFSNDPMICSTCLELRSFALGSFIPLAMGTSIAVTANLSACLLNKTLHLPRFHIQAYPEWQRFFRQHAFKGMSRRYFVAYPILNGFLASMVFLGQDYFWRNHLRQRLDSLEKQSGPVKEPPKQTQSSGPVQDFLTKFFGGKTK